MPKPQGIESEEVEKASSGGYEGIGVRGLKAVGNNK